MNKYTILWLSVVLLVVSVIAGGYLYEYEYSSFTYGDAPTGITGAWDFISSSANFLWDALTFDFPEAWEVPAIFSFIVWLPIGYMIFFIAIFWIRGSD